MVSSSQALVPELSKAARQVETLYKHLEQDLNISHAPHFKDLVCPKNWKEHAFDRWFKLKEGYSSFMIQQLLDEFGATPREWVLDPFNGSGSTIVGAMKAGINGAGFEVNPFLATLAKTKVKRWNDITQLERAVSSVLANVKAGHPVEIEPPALTITSKLFREQLDDVLRVKQEILNIDDPDVRNFLLVGFGCILERASYARKDGNGLKWPASKHPLPLLPTLEGQYRLMLEDIESSQGMSHGNQHHVVFNGDSRSFDIRGTAQHPPELVSDMLENTRYSIFSPPYANCFDYTEVYKIELWMLDFIKDYADLKVLRENSLSSHLNKKYDTGTSPSIPELDFVVEQVPWTATWGKQKMRAMVVAYFDDMYKVFSQVDRILNDKGTIICIVGNSAYGNIPVATDLFLAMQLQDLGFEDVEIRVARQLGTSSQQLKVLKDNAYLRESLVIARK